MMKQVIAAGFTALLLSGCLGDAVYFKGISDGDTVSSPLKISMGVCGMDVRKAGEVVEDTGHHHLIIDGDCIAKDETVPKDATHKHFGKGQTETTLNLTPGEHTLSLQFANGMHSSYGAEMCETIHIKVE